MDLSDDFSDDEAWGTAAKQGCQLGITIVLVRARANSCEGSLKLTSCVAQGLQTLRTLEERLQRQKSDGALQALVWAKTSAACGHLPGRSWHECSPQPFSGAVGPTSAAPGLVKVC